MFRSSSGPEQLLIEEEKWMSGSVETNSIQATTSAPPSTLRYQPECHPFDSCLQEHLLKQPAMQEAVYMYTGTCTCHRSATQEASR